jgi:hypothetical protein
MDRLESALAWILNGTATLRYAPTWLFVPSSASGGASGAGPGDDEDDDDGAGNIDPDDDEGYGDEDDDEEDDEEPLRCAPPAHAREHPTRGMAIGSLRRSIP